MKVRKKAPKENAVSVRPPTSCYTFHNFKLQKAKRVFAFCNIQFPQYNANSKSAMAMITSGVCALFSLVLTVVVAALPQAQPHPQLPPHPLL